MTFDLNSLRNPQLYDHPVEQLQIIETHISVVVLTGEIAYKVKKAVNYGFLDFSTLERRRRCCEDELRLNRRLAESLYLGLSAIVEMPSGQYQLRDAAQVEPERVVEYAIRMRQFPQQAQLDEYLQQGQLTTEHMQAIAKMVAEFHARITVADEAMSYGSAEQVFAPVEENFIQIQGAMSQSEWSRELSNRLTSLQRWSVQTFERLRAVFQQRKRDGFIRECHGDMHLRNLLWLDEAPMAFDCIEFNDQFRWIDVISEIAFLVMDLQDRQQDKLAYAFLNDYLEYTGDYAGLRLLPFYLCYRAMVRAKVDALRLTQCTISEERNKIDAEFVSYLNLAEQYIQPSRPALWIMRGVSGSGKSTLAARLMTEGGAIRIRSDVERKRIMKISRGQKLSGPVGEGIYSAEITQLTYQRLLELAHGLLSEGYHVIVDATFLPYEQRVPFRLLADAMHAPFRIIEAHAPPKLLRERLRQRQHGVSDATGEVLEYQLANWQPLHDDERAYLIDIDTTMSMTDAQIQSCLDI